MVKFQTNLTSSFLSSQKNVMHDGILALLKPLPLWVGDKKQTTIFSGGDNAPETGAQH